MYTGPFLVDDNGWCYRDMGLDITCESMDNIYGKAMSHVLSCEWKLFILSPAMLQALQDDKVRQFRFYFWGARQTPSMVTCFK